ncbi:ATP-binding cassette subfamily C protein CydD [Thermosporothrix hazakensis]|jgi:ATP-binding cassette subfamily C protein CydD|uniref:ATP-binding cassette subfamily C protein CydD n=2 Tax=Thermosporothrix TaxID=768650 RepID=A0A326TZJ7_THEHA|nr:thiol reductant ABC exporter subunit CydD [Thermosporothrix hazakensis]PZW22929.1 ATP-binding cassette subfamily C protein CydD [Thermosporothrix hazakensis]BBH89793.1 thiol reductant ABC exporter subunit CydD [Thermosporothrix sp. COM3]GCE47982.1 thiol reductant ABC exporter subunit CydD [Thermosporothrix hazakensis]
MKKDFRLLRQVPHLWAYIAILLGISTLAGLFTVLQAFTTTRIINHVFLARQALAQVAVPLAFLLVAIVGRALLHWVSEAVAHSVAGTVKARLREHVFQHVLALGPAYTRGERSGELTTTLTEGIEAIDAYFSQYIPQVITTVIITGLMLVVVFFFDTLSGIVLLVTLPLLPFFMILIGKTADALTKKRWSEMSLMSAHFLDVLQGLTTLKLFGRSKEQRESVKIVSERYQTATMKVLRIAFVSSLVMELGATISTAIIAVEIGLRLLYGMMPFEQAFFILLLTPEFYLPMRSLNSQFHASMNSAAAAQRLFDILEIPLPAHHTPAAPQIPTLQAQLSLHNLSYSYAQEEEGQPAVQHVSFDIRAGETVALVGPSGAGKSTLAQLLLRFLEPDSGEILADGAPIHLFRAKDWRQLVAWVPQHPYLFNMSIADNIRIGRPEATREEVIEAARKAHLHDFIQSLPQGYDTVTGERGARLSGGQAQRLSLARAFLKDAPFLLLDEATSTLDPDTEAQILQAIETLRRGRMVLVIAHRLNTVYTADRIVVLQAGRVAASGTHSELIQRSELYRQLVSAYNQEEATL